MTILTRRRFIRIAVGGAAVATLAGLPAARASVPLSRWKGVVLGAEAEMVLPAADAGRLIALTLAEVGRLERIFSLYRDDSALVHLNRQGYLEAPPIELVELLARAQAVSAASGGAFDVTVQPLWEAYAAHFSRPQADPAGPPHTVLADALARVDWRAIELDAARIRFAKPGMAITLNGIAQGYITDRVAERFRSEGFDNVLLSLGETRALGPHPDGRAWQVAAGDGGGAIQLVDGAIAVSAANGTPFTPEAAVNHLFDPRSGNPAGTYGWIGVEAPTATEADAWSTAFSLTPLTGIRATLPRTAIRRVRLRERGKGAIITI